MPSLLDLPQELLDLIKIEALRYDYPLRRVLDPGVAETHCVIASGLLTTNRRLKTECTPPFYNLNTFTVFHHQSGESSSALPAFPNGEPPPRLRILEYVPNLSSPTSIPLYKWTCRILDTTITMGKRLDRISQHLIRRTNAPAELAAPGMPMQPDDCERMLASHARWMLREVQKNGRLSSFGRLISQACRTLVVDAWFGYRNLARIVGMVAHGRWKQITGLPVANNEQLVVFHRSAMDLAGVQVVYVDAKQIRWSRKYFNAQDCWGMLVRLEIFFNDPESADGPEEEAAFHAIGQEEMEYSLSFNFRRDQQN